MDFRRLHKGMILIGVLLILVGSLGLTGCKKSTPAGTGDGATNTSTVDKNAPVKVPTWDQLAAAKESKVPGAAEISGRYTGVLVFTDVKVPQSTGTKTSEEQAGEACGYAILAALKDTPLPVVIDLQVGADGKGTMIMNVEGLTDKGDSKPESVPITYNNGKITFNDKPASSDTIDTQDMSVSFLNKDYKQGLGAKAADEKTKGKALQDDIAQLKTKLASATESEKKALQQEIEQKENIAKMRDTSAAYMEQLANSNANLVLNGSFSSQSKDGQTYIKGVLTAVNANVSLPKK